MVVSKNILYAKSGLYHVIDITGYISGYVCDKFTVHNTYFFIRLFLVNFGMLPVCKVCKFTYLFRDQVLGVEDDQLKRVP